MKDAVKMGGESTALSSFQYLTINTHACFNIPFSFATPEVCLCCALEDEVGSHHNTGDLMLPLLHNSAALQCLPGHFWSLLSKHGAESREEWGERRDAGSISKASEYRNSVRVGSDTPGPEPRFQQHCWTMGNETTADTTQTGNDHFWITSKQTILLSLWEITDAQGRRKVLRVTAAKSRR